MTPNRLVGMDHLKAKVDAGADWIVTQLFFDNHVFYDFAERCSFYGIDVPLVPGIMPITSSANMHRMAELAAGVNIPAPLLRAVRRADTEELVRNVGTHWAAEQVRDLIENDVPGIHFYTLNHSQATMDICRTLGMEDFRSVTSVLTAE